MFVVTDGNHAGRVLGRFESFADAKALRDQVRHERRVQSTAYMQDGYTADDLNREIDLIRIKPSQPE